MLPIISPTELNALRHQDNFALVDARVSRQDYETSHLQGARYVDLETDLSQKGSSTAAGGRHPLPPLDHFLAVLGRLGITPASHVVVYDDKNGALAAARFWWMLRSLGHQDVQVLDGGLQSALAAGFPTHSPEHLSYELTQYKATGWKLPMATADEVATATQANDALVIDVREADRYRGEREPLDRLAGHIPGAVNVPYAGNLDATGHFLPAEALRRKYREILGTVPPERAIVHCGSGVTACHTLLAMEQAGMQMPKLYVGSWSEWSESGHEVAKG